MLDFFGVGAGVVWFGEKIDCGGSEGGLSVTACYRHVDGRSEGVMPEGKSLKGKGLRSLRQVAECFFVCSAQCAGVRRCAHLGACALCALRPNRFVITCRNRGKSLRDGILCGGMFQKHMP